MGLAATVASGGGDPGWVAAPVQPDARVDAAIVSATRAIVQTVRYLISQAPGAVGVASTTTSAAPIELTGNLRSARVVCIVVLLDLGNLRRPHVGHRAVADIPSL